MAQNLKSSAGVSRHLCCLQSQVEEKQVKSVYVKVRKKVTRQGSRRGNNSVVYSIFFFAALVYKDDSCQFFGTLLPLP